jgi:hypothetical protein
MPKRKIQSFLVELAATDWLRFPQPPYRGKNWRVRFTAATDSSVTIRIKRRSYRPKQVVIRAEDEKTAQRALNLILGAFNVVLGEHSFPTFSGTAVPRLYVAARSESEEFRFDDGPPRIASTSKIPLACMIAARASLSLQHVYALAKLSLSIETYSVPAMELDPARGENLPKSVFPEEHVRMAFAITTAYSCIEELGLEIRSSQQKPSRLADHTWNPDVRTDLERRLRMAGINLHERFAWNVRGGRTRIEIKKPPAIVKPAPWSAWRVRDGDMDLVDALDLSSFLRSKISAHRTDKRLLRVLSIYDVANVQFLARRLFLESLRFWRYPRNSTP